MTRFTPMTREELLELAPLDALGLLDEYEAALFTRSFHLADASVQHDVRELQAGVASDEALLPDVEPPASMRERTLEAVLREARSEIRLAPLATIAPSTAGPARVRRARTSTPDSRRTPAVPLRPGARQGRSLSPHAWRAATFALTASLLVALYFGLQLVESIDRLSATNRQLTFEQDTRSLLGASWMEFASDPTVTRIALRPSDDALNRLGEDVHGIMYVNEESDEAYLAVFGLPRDATCRLVGRDADGTTRRTFDFTTRAGGTGVDLGRIDVRLASTMDWVIEDEAGETLLRLA